MEEQSTVAKNGAGGTQTGATLAAAGRAEAPRARICILVRHGQTNFNVEGRLPGQLPGVTLTDEGRRQAHQAAVALSALPLSTIIASPLERARDTAEIIARGWALPVRLDARLMDTDVAHWAGRTIDDVTKNDPAWKAFIEHPTEPPPGVESLADVQARAVAVVEEALKDPSLGEYLVFVAHADVVKVILAHYTHMPVEGIRFMAIGNASLSALAFGGDGQPALLGINWMPSPQWLVARAQPQVQKPSPASEAEARVETVGQVAAPATVAPEAMAAKSD